MPPTREQVLEAYQGLVSLGRSPEEAQAILTERLGGNTPTEAPGQPTEPSWLDKAGGVVKAAARAVRDVGKSALMYSEPEDPGNPTSYIDEDLLDRNLEFVGKYVLPLAVGGVAGSALGKAIPLAKSGIPALLTRGGKLVAETSGYAAGSQITNQALQELGFTKDEPIDRDLESAMTDAGINLLAPIFVKPVAKGARALSSAAQGGLNRLAHGIDNMLDPIRSLGRAMTENVTDYMTQGKRSVLEFTETLRDTLLSVPENERGEIFGPLFDTIKKRTGPTAKFINKTIDIGINLIKKQNMGHAPVVEFGDMLDKTGLEQRLAQMIPGAEKTTIASVVKTETDNVARMVLGEEGFAKYQKALEVQKKLGGRDVERKLYEGTEGALAPATETELARLEAAQTEVANTQRMVANFEMPLDEFVDFRRRLDKLSKWDKKGAASSMEEVTKAALYRDLANASRSKIEEFFTPQSVGKKLSAAYRWGNQQYGAMQELLPLLDARKAEEIVGATGLPAAGNVRVGGGGSGLAGRITGLLDVPPETHLRIAKGQSALNPLEGISPMLKSAASALEVPIQGARAADWAMDAPQRFAVTQLLNGGTQSALAEEPSASALPPTMPGAIPQAAPTPMPRESDAFFQAPDTLLPQNLPQEARDLIDVGRRSDPMVRRQAMSDLMGMNVIPFEPPAHKWLEGFPVVDGRILDPARVVSFNEMVLEKEKAGKVGLKQSMKIRRAVNAGEPVIGFLTEVDPDGEVLPAQPNPEPAPSPQVTTGEEGAKRRDYAF